MSEMTDFDKNVGAVAGTIYSDVCGQFSPPPLILVPALTYKVRKAMECVTDARHLSNEQKTKLAKEITASIIPMLLSCEIKTEMIEQMTPLIESAAFKALMQIT